jgi:TRAP transporter TAXI family solute receptor
MMKKILVGVTCLALILVTLPLTSACANPKASSGYEIEIYGGKAGMSTYVAAIALADLINANSSWLKATAIESPNITANFQLLYEEPERRADTLIISMTSFAYLAREGKEPFPEQYDGLRFISTVGYSFLSYVTLDPEIRRLADFSGKRISLGDRSSTTRVEMLQAIFESAGIWDDVELEYLDVESGANALRDGLIDATIGSLNLVSPPDKYAASPFFAELMSTKTVYFVSMDSKDITYMNKKLGPLETEHSVPAGSMGPTQSEPWTGLGKPFGWAADLEMPDEVVYEICRIVYENADLFQEYNPALACISQETMANWGVPEEDIHPGALKFYKEKGLEIGSY